VDLLRRYAACISAGDRHRRALRRGRDGLITGAVCVAGREAAVPMKATIAREDGLIEIDVIDVVEVDDSGRFTKLCAFFDLAGARKV
jgi:hypothetical protein